jgi:transposase
LTGGEAHDCPIAERLIRRVKPAKRMLGDKAYDSAELREELHERGTKPVIPNRSNRKQPFRFSKRLYKLRWRIEAAFNRLKDFRRIATRYDRLARNYLASVCLAAALAKQRNCNASLNSLMYKSEPSLQCRDIQAPPEYRV